MNLTNALTNAGWKVIINFGAAAGTIANGPVTIDISVQGSAMGFKSDTPTDEDLNTLPRHVISLRHFNKARVLKELSTMESEGGDTAANLNSAATGYRGETAQVGPATAGVHQVRDSASVAAKSASRAVPSKSDKSLGGSRVCDTSGARQVQDSVPAAAKFVSRAVPVKSDKSFGGSKACDTSGARQVLDSVPAAAESVSRAVPFKSDKSIGGSKVCDTSAARQVWDSVSAAAESAGTAENVPNTSRRSGLPARPKTAATANRPSKPRSPAPTPAVQQPPTTRATSIWRGSGNSTKPSERRSNWVHRWIFEERRRDTDRGALKAIATKFRRLGITADTPANRERAQGEMLTCFFKSVQFRETETKISLRTDDQRVEQEIELVNNVVDTSEPGLGITPEITTNILSLRLRLGQNFIEAARLGWANREALALTVRVTTQLATHSLTTQRARYGGSRLRRYVSRSGCRSTPSS